MLQPSARPHGHDLPSEWRREILALIAATPIALFVRSIRHVAANDRQRVSPGRTRQDGAASPT